MGVVGRIRLKGITVLFAGVVLTALVTVARAASPAPGVNLSVAEADVTVAGNAFENLGTSVAAARDFDNDGQADLVVGAPGGAEDGQGIAYVLFGPLREQFLDVAALGGRGVTVVGASAGDRAGFSVEAAGDVNGDDVADLVVGAPSADPRGREDAGAAYVVFGRRTRGSVSLGDLGSRGFRIDGARAGDYAGFSVAAAGDLNRDGRGDVIVGAPALGHHRAYAAVVYGRAGAGAVDLASLSPAGFRIEGLAEPVETGGQLVYDQTGASVAAAGDVNGDGRRDLIVGSPGPGNKLVTGNAYVLFMPARPSRIQLGALGAGGFRIQGAQGFDFAGESVATAGDVNGDGFADIVTGATGAHEVGFESGAAYVVYGKRDSKLVDLERLGRGGYRMDGAEAGEYAGWAVTGVRNVGGSARPDIVVGAPGANGDSGSAYVVFGDRPPGAFNLANLGTGGFRLDGIDDSDFAGASIASAGDLNGDGQADVVLGAPHVALGFDQPEAGAAYVVFVSPQQPTTPPPPPPSARCKVPAVKGATVAAARARIVASGCSVGGVKRTYSPKVRAGRVVSQKPSAGATLSRGAKVILVVSRGRRR